MNRLWDKLLCAGATATENREYIIKLPDWVELDDFYNIDFHQAELESGNNDSLDSMGKRILEL